MRVAVLSPHFDDAVLSCWHVLRAPGTVVVVNVFSGAPSGGGPLGWWDRRTGARDSAARMRERAREDRAALAIAGRTAVDLGLLELQYRAARAAPEVVTERITVAVAGCDVVHAPLALDAHPDHVLVRDAALQLRSAGTCVRLYADLPHGLSHGRPTWLAHDGVPSVDAAWARAVADAVPEGRPSPRVHALAVDERQRKLAAVAAYRTQLPALEAMAFAPLEESLRYEVVWELSST
jgi:LmbE family N-acetylglucosaminyl deacetylase